MKPETRKMLLAFARSAIADPEERAAAVLALQPRMGERPDKMLKTREALELLGVSRRTLTNWQDLGIVAPKKLTIRMYRWSRNELEALMANGLPQTTTKKPKGKEGAA